MKASKSESHLVNLVIGISILAFLYLLTAGPGMRLAIRGNNSRASQFFYPVYRAAQHKPLAPVLRPYFRLCGVGFPGDLYMGGKLVEERY